MSKPERLVDPEVIIANQDRLTRDLVNEKAKLNGDYIGTLLDTVRRAAGPRPEGYR